MASEHAAIPTLRSAPRFFYLSELLGRRVRCGARELGRVADLIVSAREVYPPIDGIVLRDATSGERVRISAENVESWDGRAITLREPPPEATPLPTQSAPDRIRLVEEILDRQIVDVDGAKVVRVNDLHFLLAAGRLRLAHVDAGFRGLVRRMGWEKFVDLAVKSVRPGAKYLREESLISWKLVQPLEISPGKIRLDVAQRMLATMHPADLADVIEDLGPQQRAALVDRMDVETAAGALEETSPEIATAVFEEIPAERAADILEEMDADEAADVLGDLPEAKADEVLEAMEEPEAKEVEALLEHPPLSAGGLMTPELIRLSPGTTAKEAIDAVRRRLHEIAHTQELFVVEDDEVLLGILPLEQVVTAEPSATLRSLARPAPASVGVDAPLAEVAEAAAKYKMRSVPVLAEGGRLAGAVPLDVILPHVLHAS